MTDTLIHQAQAHARGREVLLHEPTGGDPGKLTLVRARGSLVWDEAGRQYIDCTAQAWSNNLGANDPRVIEAAIEQTRQITHARPTFHTPALLELAELLVAIAPDGLDRVGFTLHGSMAVEMALKLALRNRPDARHVAVLHDAYHGRSITTMAASWPHPDNVFGVLQPQFLRLPRPDLYRPRPGLTADQDTELTLQIVRETLTKGTEGPVAALIYEPIQGNGGHNDFSERWHRGIREICDELGIMLIIDEVQTGLGRTGRMWASDYYGIEPDVLVFGKGVGGGFPSPEYWPRTASPPSSPATTSSPSASSRSPSPRASPPSGRSSTTACATARPRTASTPPSGCARCRPAIRSSATYARRD